MKQQERLFLLDGMALAYRAYFAFITRPLINSKGENTSAVYGFVTALMKILEDEKPDHIAVVFDTHEPTFRHKMYEEYKATRQKMPEGMSLQMEKLKEVVRAFNTPLLELPGYEADDIIGTLARRAEREGVLTYMVTGDKDFMQLISPSIRMYKPGKASGDAEIVDEAGVLQKFGVTPDKVIDVLGLIGDKSDNVPGVPGIGERTAIPLIQQYGSIPGLYEHVEDVPQKGVREKLITHREKALLSRKLVTIDTNVPIDIDFHQLQAARRDTSRLIKLFGELEFKSLAGRLRDTEPFDDIPPPPASTSPETSTKDVLDISTDEHQYQCITTEAGLRSLAARLAVARRFVFDTETTSTNPFNADLVGISLCLEEREAYYIPVTAARTLPEEEGTLFAADKSAPPNYTDKALSIVTVLGMLKPILENPSISKIGQNIKYDMLVLRNHGIGVQGVAFDTMVASYILRADAQHNLDALATQHLHYRMIPFEEMVGKGKNLKHITEVPLEEITRYSAEDADMTMRVHQKQRIMLEEQGLLQLCEALEFPLISVLERMEGTGITLDVDYLGEMSKDLERQIDTLVRSILDLAGEQFNINSTQQLGHILFDVLKLRTVRKTRTGFSTDVNVLEELRGEHPIIEKLLEYRQLTKLKSTYVDALPLLINPKTRRVHTSFNQTVAATGRLSGSDPNLQNIPIRTELGRAIRKAFVAGDSSHVLLSADYSQIELRVMAHISGDEGLQGAFLNKEDIHTSTASKVFGVEPRDITRDMRRKAKEVNFGIMYGIGPFGLANRLEISQTEAREIITTYFERFPRVKQYVNDTIATARRTGYVHTLLGRRRYLPDINSRNQNVRGNAERQAINMPIQGTAADMIKLAMIALDQEIRTRSFRSRMLLQVHDELVFEVPEAEIPEMKTIVADRMRNAMSLSVPLEVEIGTGKHWLDAH